MRLYQLLVPKAFGTRREGEMVIGDTVYVVDYSLVELVSDKDADMPLVQFVTHDGDALYGRVPLNELALLFDDGK